MKHNETYQVPRSLQLLYVIGSTIYVFMQGATSLYYTVKYQQMDASFNTIATSLWSSAQVLAIPIIFLIVIHLSHKYNKKSLSSVFYSFVMTSVAYMAFYTVTVLMHGMYNQINNASYIDGMYMSSSAGFWTYATFTLFVPFITTFVGGLIAVRHLRRYKQW